MAAVWFGQSDLPGAPWDRVAGLLVTLGQARQTAEGRFMGSQGGGSYTGAKDSPSPGRTIPIQKHDGSDQQRSAERP
jgi:hypothetical protein